MTWHLCCAHAREHLSGIVRTKGCNTNKYTDNTRGWNTHCALPRTNFSNLHSSNTFKWSKNPFYMIMPVSSSQVCLPNIQVMNGECWYYVIIHYTSQMSPGANWIGPFHPSFYPVIMERTKCNIRQWWYSVISCRWDNLQSIHLHLVQAACRHIDHPNTYCSCIFRIVFTSRTRRFMTVRSLDP